MTLAAAPSTPDRVASAVARSRWSRRIADAQATAYAPVLAAARRSPLHSDALGHSLHPVLTDLTLGCWSSTTLLDLVAGDEGRRSASRLAAVGAALAVPTAVAGAADWSELEGGARSIGAVHALGTDVATFLFVGSVVARARGQHALGVRLAVAGNVMVAAAGFLGGHLALVHGTALRARRTGLDARTG